MKPKWAFGLDLGGTNARLALVSHRGVIVDSVRRQTEEVGSPQIFVKWAAEESAALLKRVRLNRAAVAGIGVGVPGPVDQRLGRILMLPNVPQWKNVPLEGLLKKASGLPVAMDNDGNVMTVAEHLFGAARGTHHTLFITLGTGIGGGMIYDGKIFRGSTFSAMEISHMRHGGSHSAPCGCGSRGCLETWLGNRPLRNRAEKELRPFSAVLKNLVTKSPDHRLRLEHVTQAATAGDRRSAKFWADVAAEFGDFLGGICNLLNPEMIVIGGGVAGAGNFLFNPLRAAVRRQAFALATERLKIVPAKFGADAGIIGAAALAFARSEESK